MTPEPKMSPNLRMFALAAIAAASDIEAKDDAAEAAFLREQLQAVERTGNWARVLANYVRQPDSIDDALLALADSMQLRAVEVLAIALAASVETDFMSGRAIAYVQAPIGGSRPTLGLAGTAFAPICDPDVPAVESLLTGAAVRSGLLALLNEGAPAAERPLAVPLALCLALRGQDFGWPGAALGQAPASVSELTPTLRCDAERHAIALQGGTARGLVVRSNSPSEGRSIAAAVAEALGRRPLFLENNSPQAGLAPFLLLRGFTPVYCLDLAPGERKSIEPLTYYTGPMLAVCGPDGSVDFGGEPAVNWPIGVPSRDERRELWTTATGNPTLAERLAKNHRHSCGRINHLGRLARHCAIRDGRQDIQAADVLAASWIGESAGLDALAQPLPDAVSPEALVTTPSLRLDLDRLHLRCLARDGLADTLGISASTRYRPGVRALFTGASGTGKTLAAGWLASRLGLPLYRVDLASITSKYIGETEKNLAQLMARAEHAEVVLLFDEADSLFARRTEVRDSNDRFANAQTNYLLQRIETFDGIALLTANSRARFDTAFARRLDAVIEFPPPGPQERRAIWQSHLGDRHGIDRADINRLAVAADLCGGHIRNAVLAAAVLAQAADGVLHRRHRRRHDPRRLDDQAGRIRSVAPLSADRLRLRRAGVADRRRSLGRQPRAVQPRAGQPRLHRRQLRQSRHAGAERHGVAKDRLRHGRRSVLEGAGGRGAGVRRVASVRRRQPRRRVGLERRRLEHAEHDVPLPRRLHGRRGSGTGARSAPLRYDLSGTLHGHAAEQRGRLSHRLADQFRRGVEGQAARHPWIGG
jgi:hypothetical protein